MQSSSPENLRSRLKERTSLVSTLVKAGAGAGKTTFLTESVLGLALQYYEKENRWPRLVVTTFTRKATHELKERILKKALQLESEKLTEFAQKKSHLQISTIHGVLYSFLKSYGTHLGLSPQLIFLNSTEEKRVLKKKIRELISNNDDFRLAFENLMEFMEWNQLLQGLPQILSSVYLRPDLAPYSETQVRQARAQLQGDVLQLFQRIKIASAGEKLNAAWTDYLSQDVATNPPRIQNACSEDFKNQIKSLQALLEISESFFYQEQNLPAYAQMAKSLQIFLNHLSQAFYQHKISRGQISLEDLEVLSLRLIRDHSFTAESFSNEWDFWLIDEYQDTSPRQVELIQSLQGAKKSYVVGDPQQSIYLFRGADPGVFLKKENETKISQGRQEILNTNYRSTATLISFFNSFFAKINSQYLHMLVAPNPKPALERPSEIRYYHPGKIRDVKSNPSFDIDNWELKTIVAEIVRALEAGVAAQDIAVLHRKNDDLEKLAKVCFELQIPVELHSSGSFFHRQEIQDATHILKFLLNPHDNLNFLSVLRSPWFFLEDQKILDMLQTIDPKASSYWDHFKKFDVEPISQLSNYLQRLRLQSWLEVLTLILFQQKMFLTSHAMDPSGRREANLWKWLQILSEDANKENSQVLKWLDTPQNPNLESSTDQDGIPSKSPSRVQLMTIHASKGLQFEHVILFGMGKYRPQSSQNLFYLGQSEYFFGMPNEESKTEYPAAVQMLKAKQKENERAEYDRLLYVALTRAENSLSLVLAARDSEAWTQRIWHPDPSESVIYLEGEFLPQLLTSPKTDTSPMSRRRLDLARLPVRTQKSFSQNQRQSFQTADFDAIKAAQRGIRAHSLFESLKYRPQTLASELSLDPALTKAIRFLHTWQQGQILKIISAGEVEFDFKILVGGEIQSGQIDLWGIVDGKLYLVDYKTGQSRYSQKAFEQLSFYLSCLHLIQPDLKALDHQLLVVYPFEEKVEINEFPIRHSL